MITDIEDPLNTYHLFQVCQFPAADNHQLVTQDF